MAGVLAQRAGQGAAAADVAAALAAIWDDIETALSPVLGQRGVALLYKRSLYLTTQQHPWLTPPNEGANSAMDLDALKTAFAQQHRADAAASAGGALLQNFHALLASLVGPSLTGRLLRSVLAPSTGGHPAQDTTP